MLGKEKRLFMQNILCNVNFINLGQRWWLTHVTLVPERQGSQNRRSKLSSAIAGATRDFVLIKQKLKQICEKLANITQEFNKTVDEGM